MVFGLLRVLVVFALICMFMVCSLFDGFVVVCAYSDYLCICLCVTCFTFCWGALFVLWSMWVLMVYIYLKRMMLISFI